MYKQCKTQQSAKRQREIAEIMLSVLEKRRLSSISVTELCRRAGIPRKAFYRYFESREDILTFLVDCTLQEFHTYTTSHNSGRARTRAGDVEDMFTFFQGMGRLLAVLHSEGRTELLVVRAVTINMRLESSDDFWNYLSANRDNTEQFYRDLFVMLDMITMMLLWQQNGCVQTPHRMAEMAQNILAEPLTAHRSLFWVGADV